MGWFSGKSKVYKADPLAGDINAAGKEGLDGMRSAATGLNALYDQDPTQLVNSQIGLENKMLRGASDDAARRTRQLLAQRGMGNSSIGLGQEVNQARTLAEKLGMNTASGIQRLRDMQIGNAQGKMGVAEKLWGIKASQGPVQMQDIRGPRTGGFGQLAMTLAGAGAGYAATKNSQGAQAGAQMGSAAGGSMQRQ